MVRRRADAVVAVSEAVKQSVIADCGRRVQAKLSVIYNGIDLQRFTYRVERTNTVPVLTVVGRLEEQKGHLLLCKALRRVRCPYQLRIIGNGSLRQKIVRRAGELGIADHVSIEDARPDIEQVYRETDIVIVPSRWEGFGLVAVEAMASGCVVIASDVDGLKEVIAHEQNGFLVDMDQHDEVAHAIDRLCADVTLRQRLAAAGQQTTRERFGIDHMVTAYETLYNKLYEGPANQ
jgi:glycosyltransferase involved in cell wall biosynthesis